MEGVHRQAGDYALAQGLDVVTVGLAFKGGAFAKPAARRHTGKSHGLAVCVVAAHLEQAVDHAKPVGYGPPSPAHQVSGQSVAYLELPDDAFPLIAVQHRQPGYGDQFCSVRGAAAVVQGEVG